jgi:MFS family permease
LIGLFNYTDRFIFSAFSDTIKSAFHFDDAQIGILGGAFLAVYAIVALPIGYLADRISRKTVVAIGVAVWSAATALTGLVSGFATMFGVRALVGIGEGSYFPAGTPLLSAYYPPKARARVMARWQVGTLVGGAVGFLVATVVTAIALDWRFAFYICAAPGLLLAVLMFLIRDKLRHEEDPPPGEAVESHSFWSDVRTYLGIPTMRVIIGTYAFGFFALYAIATFLVIYLSDTYGTSSSFGSAGLSSTYTKLLPGVVLVIGGAAGNLLGGRWADVLSRRNVNARVFMGGLGFLLAAPCVGLTLATPYILQAIPAYHSAAQNTQVQIGAGVFVVLGMLAATTLNLYNGPTTAAIQDVVPPHGRAFAGGLSLTFAHLLGDVYAGAAVGALSDALGGKLGLALLLTCPAALVCSGVIGIWGSRFYARDVAALGTSAETILGVS